jgi:transketolase
LSQTLATALVEETALTTQPLSPAAESDSVSQAISWRSINTIRVLAMEAVERAQSGHPGTPMALAPTAYLLWTLHLKHHPRAPDWADRDRFVLSCGHASMLLYSLLYLSGYGLTLDDLRAFRQWGSRTPGHPERGHAPGVETTTGPLGQGVGNAVGMAIAERLLAERFNRPGHEIVDHRTWALVSDGDLMEGVASEAASLAGHLRLGKLTLVYDDNHITIDGDTALAFSEDVGRRFEAYGWRVDRVADGNDLDAIDLALGKAREESERPTLVIVRTVIADPAPTKRNTADAHGAPLGKDEVRRTKEILGWPAEEFHVPGEVLADMGRAAEAGRSLVADWEARFAAYRSAHPDLAATLLNTMAGRLPEGWESCLPSFPTGAPLATRQASGQVLGALVQAVPQLAGGSADLAGSTGVTVKHGGVFGPGRTGRALHFGIREHGMAAVMNGMAVHGGVRPFGSTFLVFSDYMKPSIRLAALMGAPVIYLFSHDSIGLGEDGPTHQPVEHLAMLRSIPNMVVVRPADANETVEAWRIALQRTTGPTAIVLTRQKVPVFDRGALAPAEGVRRGGYVLFEPSGGCRAIVIATGSEVAVALDAAQRLGAEGIPTRVVSLPSWELFAGEPARYRDEVLPPTIRARVSIEAATTFGWRTHVTEDGESIGLDRFGASAPGDQVLRELGFTPEAVVEAVRRVVRRAS